MCNKKSVRPAVRNGKKKREREPPVVSVQLVASDDSDDIEGQLQQYEKVAHKKSKSPSKQADKEDAENKEEIEVSVRTSTPSELGEIGICMDDLDGVVAVVEDKSKEDTGALQSALEDALQEGDEDAIPEADSDQEDDTPLSLRVSAEAKTAEAEKEEEEAEEAEAEEAEAEAEEAEEVEEVEEVEELSTQDMVAQIRGKWGCMARKSVKDYKSKRSAVREVMRTDALLYKLEGNSAHTKLVAYVNKKKPNKKEGWVRTTADMLFLMLATKTKAYKTVSSLLRYIDKTPPAEAMAHICLDVLNKKADSEGMLDLVSNYHESVAQIAAN